MPTPLLVVALTPLVVAYLIAAFRDPLRWVLPPYAASLPFSSLLSVGPEPFGSASSVLGMLLGAALLMQLVTTQRGNPRLSVVVPIWLTFLALTALSFLWTIGRTVTIDGVIVLASLVILFVALALSRFDRIALRRFENAVMAGGLLVVGYGLYQVLFAGGLPTTIGGTARFGDDLLDANNQAAALLLPLVIAAGRSLSGARSSRLLHGAATVLLLLGILLTGSRGGLIASMVAMAAVLALSAGRGALKVAVAAIAALLLVTLLVIRPFGVGDRLFERGESSSGRTDIWTVGLHSCDEYCLFGAGWGTFPLVYKEQLAKVPEAQAGGGRPAYEAHNIYLLALVEVGVLGLALMVLGLGAGLRTALRLPVGLRGPPAAALMGHLVSSFFLSNLEYKFFWAMLAYIVIAESVAVMERSGSRSAAGHPQLSATPVRELAARPA
ncbi:O-antigen ligase family protein [Blastococcus goldschmidtiae]|uniref:O-antigen ligase family protein n=1 Tax=Blastococcus goldschmidtiae TaxID=3075546 RepID=A0ABU2KB18_9ACTN|nr:O-antigen ligase family protein [Blastococcus sp. DSM 46792]MDT0277382.1 O-antigen ligase family protein [Blastococcus sp. DSM 46792]